MSAQDTRRVPDLAASGEPARSPAPPAGAGSRRLPLADRDSFLAKAFLLPSIVYIVALVGVPFALAIAFSFSDVTAGDPSLDWAGLRNYRAIFEDDTFWRSLVNTLIFTLVSMVLVVVFGKVLANILIADFRGKWLVRFAVLLPWTTPVALSSISWLWLLDSVFSPVDWVLRQIGYLDAGENTYWLGRPGLAMASVIAVHVWRLVPLAAVIVMAGLVAIPRDLDDAGRVDGAGYWRRMFGITLPLAMPVIAVAGLFGAIMTFTDMAVVYVLTRGGPTNSTQVLASWAFFKGIQGGDVAQGAAIALFLFPLLLAAAVAILSAVRRMDTL